MVTPHLFWSIWRDVTKDALKASRVQGSDNEKSLYMCFLTIV